MSIQLWLVALHFFCPTLTPPGMAERVLPPDGFLLLGSPGETCTFSKQLQLASLGNDCSCNLYCPTSILKHLAITFPLILTHTPSLSFMLYYTYHVPSLSYILLTHPHSLTPHSPLTSTLIPHPSSQSSNRRTPSTSLSLLSLCRMYPLPLPCLSVICTYTLCYAVCLYTVYSATGVQGSDEIPKMGSHKTEGLCKNLRADSCRWR